MVTEHKIVGKSIKKNILGTKKILIVEDELIIAEDIKSILQKQGYHVIGIAMDYNEALRILNQKEKPDLVLLDVMLPGLSGLDVCKKLRTMTKVPIIMLTAKDTELDKVLGLEIGADDYIIKPFDPAEVVARVRAQLRKGIRDAARAQSTARFAQCIAHFDRYVLVDEAGKETSFSHAEGEVLRLFLENPNRLISRAQMQESLGGVAGESFDRAMDVRVSRLRTKLGEDPKNPKLIKTIYGAGYIFLGEVTWS